MSDPIRSISQNNYLLSNGGGGGSYTAGEFIDITNDVISVNSGDVSNLIPGSGILITQSSAGTTVSIDPEELPAVESDETVLWEGSQSGTGTLTLSEPCTNFEELAFTLGESNNMINYHKSIVLTEPALSTKNYVYPYFVRTNSGGDMLFYMWSVGLNSNSAIVEKTVARTNGTSSSTNYNMIKKIVGIGRKHPGDN